MSRSGPSASRIHRRRRRLNAHRRASDLRKLLELASIQSDPLPGVPAGGRGTTFVRVLPRVPARSWGSISTHGFGVAVERAPRYGFSLKAKRPFLRGAYITQYEGILLGSDEAKRLAFHKQTHLLGLGGRAGKLFPGLQNF